MDITNTENLFPLAPELSPAPSPAPIAFEPCGESSAFWVCIASLKKLPGSS